MASSRLGEAGDRDDRAEHFAPNDLVLLESTGDAVGS